MKTNRSTNWIRIALWSLVLAFVVIFLMLPLLAKGITRVVDNPIEPEKLDIRPIPVPVPPTSWTNNEPPVITTSSPSFIDKPVPQAMPVPTPLVSATQTALVEQSMSASSIRMTVHITNQQEFLAMALVFVVLLIWIWLYRVPNFHSWNKESA